MKPVFVDTSYYVALLSQADAYHAKAVEVSRTLRRPVVVTEFVLLELGNVLSRTDARQLFVSILRQLRGDPHVLIIAASPELFERGCDLYARRSDKDWSLTDCISFVVMEERALSDALTTDHHFEQAGFQILLK
jgi:predicted nucleic acid-binding protein